MTRPLLGPRLASLPLSAQKYTIGVSTLGHGRELLSYSCGVWYFLVFVLFCFSLLLLYCTSNVAYQGTCNLVEKRRQHSELVLASSHGMNEWKIKCRYRSERICQFSQLLICLATIYSSRKLVRVSGPPRRVDQLSSILIISAQLFPCAREHLLLPGKCCIFSHEEMPLMVK